MPFPGVGTISILRALLRVPELAASEVFVFAGHKTSVCLNGRLIWSTWNMQRFLSCNITNK